MSPRRSVVGTVGKEAALGAAKGGAGGAALGAAKGLAKVAASPEGRRKLLMLAALASLPAVVAISALLFAIVGGNSLTAISTNNQDQAALQAAYPQGMDPRTATALYGASEATGVPWEVLAAIIYYETGPGAAISQAPGVCVSDPVVSTTTTPQQASTTTAPQASTTTAPQQPLCPSTAGPNQSPGATSSASATTATTASPSGNGSEGIGAFGIVPSALSPPEQALAQAPDGIEWTASWVAGALHRALVAQPGWDNQPFDSGEVLGGDDKPQIDETDPNAIEVRDAWEAALAKLPVEHNGAAFDANVFDLALQWYLGYTTSGAGGLSGISCAIPNGAGVTISGPGGIPVALTAEQVSNAAKIVNVTRAVGQPAQAGVVALMTALTESSIEDLPNAAVPGSTTDPNVQWGSYSPANPPHNGTSVGFYQQQDNWGTVAQRMDPVFSTELFLGVPPNDPSHPPGLAQVPNWQSMPMGVAAQTVQVSAFPDRYAQWQTGAEALASYVQGVSCTSLVSTTSAQAAKVISAAQAELGLPYVWGGGGAAGPSGSATAPPSLVGHPGFDCSGLTQYAYAQAGIPIPRTSETQFALVKSQGRLVTSISQLQPGDLVFFGGHGYDGTPSQPGHVGIYIGNSQMIDAPYTGTVVRVDTFSSAGFVGGGPG